MEKFEIIRLNQLNIDDFAKARNELMAKSKSEWILFVDTDEEITNHQSTITNKFSSYQFTRQNYFLNQYVGKDRLIRLVKKGTGKWTRMVHEVWIPNKHEKVGYLKNVYITHNTANNLRGYINKINNYSILHAKANKIEGKTSNILKIIFFPLGKFFITLIKSRNVVFSIMQAFHSFLSWSQLYLMMK